MEIRDFVAAGIAEDRAKKARDGAKAAMLQMVQLDGGSIVEDEEGVKSIRVLCPACGPDRPSEAAIEAALEAIPGLGTRGGVGALMDALGTIEVEVPYGLTEGTNGRPWVDLTAVDDETLVWAVRNGYLNVTPNSEAIRAQADTTVAELLVMLPKLGVAIHKSESQFVKRMTTKQAKAAK